MANERCSIRVFSGYRWDMGGHPCAKPATMEHEGKRYCKLHYPPTVAAKRAADTERWRQQNEQRKLGYQIQDAERAVLTACEVWINSKESDQQSEDDLSSAIAAWRDLKQKRG